MKTNSPAVALRSLIDLATRCHNAPDAVMTAGPLGYDSQPDPRLVPLDTDDRVVCTYAQLAAWAGEGLDTLSDQNLIEFLDAHDEDTVTVNNPWTGAAVTRPLSHWLRNSLDCYSWPQEINDALDGLYDSDAEWLREAINRLGPVEAGKVLCS